MAGERTAVWPAPVREMWGTSPISYYQEAANGNSNTQNKNPPPMSNGWQPLYSTRRVVVGHGAVAKKVSSDRGGG